jgi:hypothetical protein
MHLPLQEYVRRKTEMGHHPEKAEILFVTDWDLVAKQVMTLLNIEYVELDASAPRSDVTGKAERLIRYYADHFSE